MMSVKSKQKNNSKQFYMEKKRNLWVIPTDKPSRLSILNNGKLNFGAEFITSSFKVQNIYITSDEEIKERDWVLFISTNEVIKVPLGGFKGKVCKKIIITTDQYLIKDGVQAIDDEFLEWFGKNPSCDEVEVMKMFNMIQFTSREYIYYIILPKEEPKQETLEEAKKRILDSNFMIKNDADIFEMGVKWQQENSNINALNFEIDALKKQIELLKYQQERMYSEEEVYNILIHHTVELFKKEKITLEDFWNKFKKK